MIFINPLTQTIEQSSDGQNVSFDGTEPKLENVNIYTSNKFDNVMAKEAVTPMFIAFNSSIFIQNLSLSHIKEA